MTVLLIRANQNERDQQQLEPIPTLIDPYLSISKVVNPEGAQKLLQALKEPDAWLVITSTNAIHFFEANLEPNQLQQAIKQNPTLNFAAIGQETKKQLQKLTKKPILTAEANSESLAQAIAKQNPKTLVIPSSNIAMKTLSENIEANIIDEVVYQTQTVETKPASTELIAEGKIEAVLLRSPSAARAFKLFNPNAQIKVFCAGKTTEAEALRLELKVTAIAPDPSPETVARTIKENL